MHHARANLVVLAALAVFAGGTWLARTVALSAVEEDAEGWQSARVAAAFDEIDDDFRDIQLRMVGLARDVAEDPELRSALVDAGGTNEAATEAARARLVAAFASLDVAPLTSIELYSPTPRLLAWSGFSMPLDDAPGEVAFLREPQVSLSVDADRRTALVLWWPVTDGPRVYGAIRVLRILRSRAPVQNEYLRDVDIGRIWSRRLGLGIDVALGATAPNPDAVVWRHLRGIDGSVVGVVHTTPPSHETLLRGARLRYDAALAFWCVLGFAFLLRWIHAAFARACAIDWRRAGVAWLGLTASLWITRYALIALDFPERLQGGRAPLAPLFDPTHFASDMFGGIFRTTGDLILTSLFALATAVTFYRLSAAPVPAPAHGERGATRVGLRFIFTGLALVAIYAAIVGLSVVARRLVFDSTLDYFSRTGLLPESLVLAVFSSGLALVASAVTAAAGLLVVAFRTIAGLRGTGVSHTRALLIPAAVAGAAVGTAYVAFPLAELLPPLVGFLILCAFVTASVAAYYWAGRGAAALTLRNVLFGVFLLAAILYPLLYGGLQGQKRNVLVDAADTFDNGSDPRAVFAIERVLEEASSDSAAIQALRNANPGRALDSVATSILRTSLLASLRSYEVSLTYLDAGGTPVGRYYEAEQQTGGSALALLEVADFELLLAMYRDAGEPPAMVEQITGRHERERFRYEGLRPVTDGDGLAGWVMAGAEPRTMTEEAGSPFPRVFVSTGFYGSLGEDIALAEFRDGVLVRTTGSSFGRLRLDEDVADQLLRSTSLWRRDRVRGRAYDTYYARQEPIEHPRVLNKTVVVAARASAVTFFDHLYSLLRLTVAGLFIAIPVYLLGLGLRWRAGLLPAGRVRFRDRVLNAFFGVGIVTVAAMGFVGLQVVTSENDRAVDAWLRQHLERVERALAADARAGELPYRVLDRISIDSLATQVGLDLNLFQGAELVASSRPQLIRDRLIDARLPVAAYSALSYEGYRFVSTLERVGSVRYAAGFRALPDEAGRARYILSVPTLPEQERIEEERARTVAYLFGALLLLVLVVLATASILANALTRPIARLRDGLEAVTQGRYEGMVPVESRDELGDLVETFNTMQGQLSESRRKLAQQERQLAWQEMARQVAHEIKNPLTPMKLSVQHLQRSLDTSEVQDPAFKSVFRRITKTLVEQIDALARIANEFSSFARMPRQILEPLDVNAVVREAVTLMQAESGASVRARYEAGTMVVRADREELRRAFINLIKNAIQSVPDGREPEVRIRTRREAGGEHGFAVFEVADNGAGIPEELRSSIFEPNFSTKTSGTGLGLAIVRKAIDDLHGEIEFDTELGVGTTFRVRLPVA